MAGLEALGAIASALQIADLGTRILRASMNAKDERKAMAEASGEIVRVLDLQKSSTIFSSTTASNARDKLRAAAASISSMKYEGRWLELKRWWRKETPNDQITEFALSLGTFNAEMSIVLGARMDEYHAVMLQAIRTIDAKFDEHASKVIESAEGIKQAILNDHDDPVLETNFVEAEWGGQIYESNLWTCPYQVVGHFGGLKVTGLVTEFRAWDLSKAKEPKVARLLRMIEVHNVIKNLGGVLGYHGLGLFNANVLRVMEFTPFTLEETFEMRVERSVLERYDLAISIARTLCYVHACGVIHKAICAFAIAVDEEFKNPKITEFGFSRLYITPSDGISHYVMDSIDSPEVLWEKKPHSYASDTFCYGLLLWQLMNHLSVGNYMLRNRTRGPVDGLDTVSTDTNTRDSWIFAIPRDHGSPVIEMGEGYYSLIKECCAIKPENRIPMASVVRRLQSLREDASKDDASSVQLPFPEELCEEGFHFREWYGDYRNKYITGAPAYPIDMSKQSLSRR